MYANHVTCPLNLIDIAFKPKDLMKVEVSTYLEIAVKPKQNSVVIISIYDMISYIFPRDSN